MKQVIVILLLGFISTSFSIPAIEINPVINKEMNYESLIGGEISNISNSSDKLQHISLFNVEKMLDEYKDTISSPVKNNILQTLRCARKLNFDHNQILTVIDYSLPSSKKRLWVFDLKDNKLLFNTYVTHGINSGALNADSFSNSNDSKETSIGVFNTAESYYGRHGLALRLSGLDKGFNNNASRRYLVMHGSWYVNDNFIKKYGRPGRSWGCPAVPNQLSKPIINTIKNNSIFIAYYPDSNLQSESKYLNCENESLAQPVMTKNDNQPLLRDSNESREDIIFADINNDNKYEEKEPIIVMSANDYMSKFKKTPPLNRMLRRQINKSEYIALTETEFSQIAHDKDILDGKSSTATHKAHFVIPSIRMSGRHYLGTDMKIISLGMVSEIESPNTKPPLTCGNFSEVTPPTSPLTSKDDAEKINCHNSTAGDENMPENYVLKLNGKPKINIKSTNAFIRWLGL